jgi:hypothetical protein
MATEIFATTCIGFFALFTDFFHKSILNQYVILCQG